MRSWRRPARAGSTPPSRTSSTSRTGPSAAPSSAESRSRSRTEPSSLRRSCSGLRVAGRKVALTGDTAPAASVVAAAAGADLLVHDGTFCADERERARETGHSTAGEAALAAQEAGVRLLALTHLSSRYHGPDVAAEARQLFPDTVVPRDFDLITIPFAERGAPELVVRGARLPRSGVVSEA